MASVRQYGGIYLSNLYDTLPSNFSSRLHPSILSLLQRVAGANHKLYMLFEIISSSMTHKNELYTAEQESVASWLIMLLEQVP